MVVLKNLLVINENELSKGVLLSAEPGISSGLILSAPPDRRSLFLWGSVKDCTLVSMHESNIRTSQRISPVVHFSHMCPKALWTNQTTGNRSKTIIHHVCAKLLTAALKSIVKRRHQKSCHILWVESFKSSSTDVSDIPDPNNLLTNQKSENFSSGQNILRSNRWTKCLCVNMNLLGENTKTCQNKGEELLCRFRSAQFKHHFRAEQHEFLFIPLKHHFVTWEQSERSSDCRTDTEHVLYH